jgi:hypothetical protein
MRLDGNNNLMLYSGGTPALTLNPSAQSLSLGNATLAASGSGFIANGALTVSGALTASNYTASGGTFAGGAGGLVLNSGGVDKNITIAPGGAGIVVISSRLAVANATSSTSSTTGALTVAGGVGISGDLNVAGPSLSAGQSSQANQKVSIQGSNPGTSVVSNVDQAASLYLSNRNGGANTFADIRFEDAGGNSVAGIAGVFVNDTANQGDLVFTTRAGGDSLSEKVRILGNGNVGFGTATPGSRVTIAESGGASTMLDGSDIRAQYLYAADTRYRLSTNGTAVLGLPAGHDGGALSLASSNQASVISGGGTGQAKLNFFVGSLASPKVTFSNSGNVGIGITNPGARAHIVATSSTESTTVGFTDTLRLQAANGSDGGVNLQTGWDNSINSSKLNFRLGYYLSGSQGRDVLTMVANTGNVGIGTTVPSARLDVAGNANIGGNLTITGTVVAANFSSTAVSANTVTGGSSGLILTAGGSGNQNVTITPTGGGGVVLNGNVGVGTASPVQKFEVNGGYARIAYSNGPYLDFYHSAAGANLKTMRIGSRDGALLFESLDDAYTTPTERMRISADGYVGIGTNAPTQALTVAAPIAEVTSANSFVGLSLRNTSTSGGREFRIVSNDTTNLGGGLVIYDQTANQLRLKIDPAGRVGIGTSAPAAKLHVNGTARFDGPVRIEKQGDLEMGEFTAEPAS